MLQLGEAQKSMLSAALRHVRDAENLQNNGSPDQAWHLAGFGPECIRKASIPDWAHKCLGHEQGERVDLILDFILAMESGAWRYRLQDWGCTHPVLGKWQPEVRYERSGYCEKKKLDVNSLVSVARELVDRLHAELWADGCIKEPEI